MAPNVFRLGASTAVGFSNRARGTAEGDFVVVSTIHKQGAEADLDVAKTSQEREFLVKLAKAADAAPSQAATAELQRIRSRIAPILKVRPSVMHRITASHTELYDTVDTTAEGGAQDTATPSLIGRSIEVTAEHSLPVFIGGDFAGIYVGTATIAERSPTTKLRRRTAPG